MGLRALRGRGGSFMADGGGASGVLNANSGAVLTRFAPPTNTAAAPQVLTSPTDPGTPTPTPDTAVTATSSGAAADPNKVMMVDDTGMATEPVNATLLPAPGFGINSIPQSPPGVLLATGLMGGTDNALGLISGGFDAFSAFGGTFQWTDPAQEPTSPEDSGAAADPLQADFEKFNADFQAVTDKSEVTPVMLSTVRKDFEAIQAAATAAPDETKLKALATDVTNLNGTLPTAEQTAQLEADFTAVLNSQGVTDQALISKAIADVHAVIDATHITADDLATLAADQEAIDEHMPDDPWTPALFDAAAQSGVASDAPFTTMPIAVNAAEPVAVDAAGGASGSVNFRASASGGPSLGSFSDYSKGAAAGLSFGNFTSPAGAKRLVGRFSPGNFSIGGSAQGGNIGVGAVSSSGSDANGGFWFGNVPNGLKGANGSSGKFMLGRMNGRQGF